MLGYFRDCRVRVLVHGSGGVWGRGGRGGLIGGL